MNNDILERLRKLRDGLIDYAQRPTTLLPSDAFMLSACKLNAIIDEAEKAESPGSAEASRQARQITGADWAEPSPTGSTPCARHCEARAFEVEIRRLEGEMERLKQAGTVSRDEALEHLRWMEGAFLDGDEVCGGVLRAKAQLIRDYINNPPCSGGPDGWRGIESAPRDGFHVQLWREDIQFTGYWATGCRKWIANSNTLTPIDPPPTRWRPLSAAPKPALQSDGWRLILRQAR
jgi:hypothetical protein